LEIHHKHLFLRADSVEWQYALSDGLEIVDMTGVRGVYPHMACVGRVASRYGGGVYMLRGLKRLIISVRVVAAGWWCGMGDARLV
jgi:hypothetical protein